MQKKQSAPQDSTYGHHSFFDFDGTIVDVKKRHIEVYHRVATAMSLPIVSDTIYWERKRNHQFPWDDVPADVCQQFRRNYKTASETPDVLAYDTIVPGILPVLHQLQEHHTFVLLTKRYHRQNLVDQLQQLPLTNFFPTVLTPNPGSKAEAVKQHGFTTQDSVIGDTEEDIQTAQTLKLTSVAVTWGVRTPDFLQRSNPTHLVQTPDQLILLESDITEIRYTTRAMKLGERTIVGALITFFVLINLVPFTYGVTHAPPGASFFRTVHYANDFFYYESEIAQGREQTLLAYDLFTAEKTPKVLVGWNYVLLGKLTSLFSIPTMIAYQLGDLLGELFFLISAYLLLMILFPRSVKKRILAFVLFMFSNTFPRIVPVNGVPVLSYYYSWYNYGEPFLRYPSVPHHLMIQASILGILAAHLAFEKTRKLKRIAIGCLAAGAGIILSTLQPVQWLLLCGTLGLAQGVQLLIDLKKKVLVLPRILYRAIPFFLFAGIGAPLILYMRSIVTGIPYLLESSKWEAAQSPVIPFFPTLLFYFGPVFVLGLLSLPFFLRKPTKAKLLMVLAAAVSLISFYSPLPKIMSLLNIRFLSSLPVLVAAASTTAGIAGVTRLARKLQPLCISLIVFLLLFMLVPLFFIQLNERLPRDTTNAYLYLPNNVIEAFEKAHTLSTSQDTFLVFWPFQVLFPAISGRREYFISPLADPNADAKNKEMYAFIDNRMPQPDMIAFLKRNQITFVITYSNAFHIPTPFLKQEFDNNYMRIYKVVYR